VTTMCRNGVEFGIRVSGMPGHTWFTGPAQKVVGPLFAGYKPEDSGLDIGSPPPKTRTSPSRCSTSRAWRPGSISARSCRPGSCR
jgi:hypothetical protein